MTPSVSIVFLVHNRREALRESLERMLAEPGATEVIVVDNASEDGVLDMLAADFPAVRVIARAANSGVSAINDGFAAARGDWVLGLDDDCYLPPGGLAQAVAAAEAHAADLVSFGVVSAFNPEHRFDRHFTTGLLSFWGCAVLLRAEVVRRLGGYDPAIFVWGNELELTMRALDAGFRHLHLPEVVAVHMKEPDPNDFLRYVHTRIYRVNAEHHAYIAGKLLAPRDAAGALAAMLLGHLRNGVRVNLVSLQGVRPALHGFRRGLRHRAPVARRVSHVYRRNFIAFAGVRSTSEVTWAKASAIPRDFVWRLRHRGEPPPAPAEPPGRHEEYYERRARYYPASAAVLDLR